MTLTVREISSVDIAVGSGVTLSTVGMQIGQAVSKTSIAVSGSAVIPYDNTIPQNTEGFAWAALDTAYTPKLATSKLQVELFIPQAQLSGNNTIIVALFKDNDVNAIASSTVSPAGASIDIPIQALFVLDAIDTTARTYKVRLGSTAGTLYVMQVSGGGHMGGVMQSTLTVREIAQEAFALPSGGVGPVITNWVSEPLTITGATTNPTKGTIVYDRIWWRRVGDTMEIRVEYEQSTAGTAGSGEYRVAVPGGYSVDTSKARTYAGTWAGVGGQNTGIITDQSTYNHKVSPILLNATQFRLGCDVGIVGSANDPLSQAKLTFSFAFSLPIAGWS
jgi:hypothetical protein